MTLRFFCSGQDTQVHLPQVYWLNRGTVLIRHVAPLFRTRRGSSSSPDAEDYFWNDLFALALLLQLSFPLPFILPVSRLLVHVGGGAVHRAKSLASG